MDNPVCSKTKTKSTWHNFNDVAVKINRKHQHILDYVTYELGCDGNIGSNNEMVLTGSFKSQQFSQLTLKFIKEYVIC